MAAVVKCVLCKQSFKGKDVLKSNFVKDHNLPKSDTTLNRYVNLRFSRGLKGGKWDYTERKLVLVRLLKLLKLSVSREEIEREKVLIGKTKIGHILLDFIEHDDENDSIHSSMSTDLNISKKNIVIWFMKFYNLYVNNNADRNLSSHDTNKKDEIKNRNNKKKPVVSFYSPDERQFSKCARLIEQK